MTIKVKALVSSNLPKTESIDYGVEELKTAYEILEENEVHMKGAKTVKC